MRQLTIFKSDGTRVTRGAALTGGGTVYYCELAPGDFERATLGSFFFKYDATLVAAVAFEVTNRAEVSTFAAAASGWTGAPASNPATVAIAASAGVAIRYAADLAAGRCRAVITVTTAGVLEVDENNKDG